MNKNNDNKIILFGIFGTILILIGIILNISLYQKVSEEFKEISTEIKNFGISINKLDTSLKEVDLSLNDVKTSLVEKETQIFRRNMQENGRRILLINYAGKFARWDLVKREIDEINKTLENGATLRPELSRSIQNFQNIYILKLNDAADKKDMKNLEDAWNETYNACINCHLTVRAPPEAFESLREISSEVEGLSG